MDKPVTLYSQSIGPFSTRFEKHLVADPVTAGMNNYVITKIRLRKANESYHTIELEHIDPIPVL